MSLVQPAPKVKLGATEHGLTFNAGTIINLATKGIDAMTVFGGERKNIFLNLLPILVPLIVEGVRDSEGNLPEGLSEEQISQHVTTLKPMQLPKIVAAVASALADGMIDPEATGPNPQKPADPPVPVLPTA